MDLTTIYLLAIHILYIRYAKCLKNYYTFSDANGLGRRFDGIGAISGGGATSKLLVNYPKRERDEILDYLFKPNFGASLHILKVEIGGDGQSTDGTEASHMHTVTDLNYHRGYEWWLLKEAKKRNPSIRLYGLPWTFPGWVGKKPYDKPNLTANYVTSWIKGAKYVHNMTIDYVGIWNERAYNTKYIKTLRSVLDTHELKHVTIVAADKKWEIAKDIARDPSLSAVVGIIGAHYPGTNSTKVAVATSKPLWSSEDYSTYNDDIGAGCWARILNQNYVNGNMTSTIAWNLVASYYSNLPYNRDGLMTAQEPWSGHYSVNNPIWVTAHTTQFTAPGWHYLRHGNGVGHLMNGGSYVSLVNHETGDLTIIIETMSWAKSLCIRPFLPYYTVTPQVVTLTLGGSLQHVTHLNVWFTKFDESGDTVFKKLPPLKVIDFRITLTLGVNEIYTLTTLNTGIKGSYSTSPMSRPFPMPYHDAFKGYALSAEPYNLAQQMGSFEVIYNGTTQEKTLRQMVQQAPVHWCDADKHGRTYAVIGNYSWKDIWISVDVNLNLGPSHIADGAFVGVRATKGGCHAAYTQGLFLFVFPTNGTYLLSTDLLQVQVLARGVTHFSSNWNSIEVSAHGNNVRGRVNGRLILNIKAPLEPKCGFAALGTYSYGLADFRDLKIDQSSPAEMLWRGSKNVVEMSNV